MSKEDQIKLWCKGRLFELMGGVGDNDAKTVLKELLDFIDNDPFAEPAPQAPELSKVERTGKDCKEQLASDDLEKEFTSVWDKNLSGKIDTEAALNIARHFDEWQKHRMIEKSCYYIRANMAILDANNNDCMPEWLDKYKKAMEE